MREVWFCTGICFACAVISTAAQFGVPLATSIDSLLVSWTGVAAGIYLTRKEWK